MVLLNFQVVGTDTGDSSPSVIVCTQRGRYLFNAGEGLQRFCTEHKIRLSKLRHIFLTQMSHKAVGGLPGMLLTLSDMANPGKRGSVSVSAGLQTEKIFETKDKQPRQKKKKHKQQHQQQQQHMDASTDVRRKQTTTHYGMSIHGPAGTGKYLYASRHFVKRPKQVINAIEFCPLTISTVVNEDLNIEAVVIAPSGEEQQQSHIQSQTQGHAQAQAQAQAQEQVQVQIQVQKQEQVHAQEQAQEQHCGLLASTQETTARGTEERPLKRARVSPPDDARAKRERDWHRQHVANLMALADPPRTPAFFEVKTAPKFGRLLVSTLSGKSESSSNLAEKQGYTANQVSASTVTATGCSHAVCYICYSPRVPGKFHPKKAMALGVPKGPLFGQLSRGNPVTVSVSNSEGTETTSVTIQPHQCAEPSRPGPVFAIVACPTLAHMRLLVTNSRFHLFHSSDSTKTNTSASDRGKMVCIVHMTPASVVRCEAYAAWMAQFDNSVHHIIINAETSLKNAPPFRACSRNQLLLNKIVSPRIFPTSKPQTTLDKMKRKENRDENGSWNGNRNRNIYSGECLMQFTLLPLSKLGVGRSNVITRVDVQEEIVPDMIRLEKDPDVDKVQTTEARFLSARKDTQVREMMGDISAGCEMSPCAQLQNMQAVTTYFLGTGSSIPSKYRNVTSIYLHMNAKESCKQGKTAEGIGWRGMLLDAGEGTYGQLVRHFGREHAQHIISGLECVWISHIHPDHMLGLPRLLAFREASAAEKRPLVVIGPRALQYWLQECTDIDQTDLSTSMQGKIIFASHDDMPIPTAVSDATSGGSQLLRRGRPPTHARPMGAVALNLLRERLGIAACTSVPVIHCWKSFGLVLDHRDGWRLVYSGDTRPCEALVRAGQNATVLIHEATFESGMVDDAVGKKHSTVGEAMDVAARMQAYRTVLTHFSQRYPKVVEMAKEKQDVGDGNGDADKDFCGDPTVAFDFMCIPMHELEWLPVMLPAIQALFPGEGETEAKDTGQ